MSFITSVQNLYMMPDPDHVIILSEDATLSLAEARGILADLEYLRYVQTRVSNTDISH